MSAFKYIKLTKEKRGCVWVQMSRAQKRNAFNAELIDELKSCFEKLTADDECRVILLSGEGKSFSAGADLNWMKSMKDFSQEENFHDSEKLEKMFHTINNCSKPLIALVQGHALGGGVGLVSVADYVLAQEGTKFGFTEVKLGLIPAVISPYVINKIGVSHARAWFLSGALFDASQALQMSLVHEVVSVNNWHSRIEQTIESFLQAAPKAAQEAKKLITHVSNNKDCAGYTCEQIARLRVEDEGQHGMECLLNKTKPRWTQK